MTLGALIVRSSVPKSNSHPGCFTPNPPEPSEAFVKCKVPATLSISAAVPQPSRIFTPPPQKCSVPCAVRWNYIVLTSVLKDHVLLFQLLMGEIKVCHRCCQVSSVKSPTEHVVVTGGRIFALIARRSLEQNMAQGLRLKHSQIQQTYRRAILRSLVHIYVHAL
jgi:hypothetical protein